MQYTNRKRLLTGTVPVNNFLLTGIIECFRFNLDSLILSLPSSVSPPSQFGLSCMGEEFSDVKVTCFI